MADDAPTPAPLPADSEPGRRGIPWRLVLLGVLGLYGVLLVVLNAQTVRIRFVFWETRASLVVLLLVTLAIGFLAGFLFDTLRDRRKARREGP